MCSANWDVFIAKNFGDARRVPIFVACCNCSSASLLSSSLSSWLPWIYSPFPFFMESCNDLQLQLIECIESTRNEVKRKMSVCVVVHRCTKVTACVECKKKLWGGSRARTKWFVTNRAMRESGADD